MAERESKAVSSPRRSRSREHALETAARLFYAQGVRAVGMEQIVGASGIAKTTIYRHFPSKDDLISAFLEREDEAFWAAWDREVDGKKPLAQIRDVCAWIGSKMVREGYRGCPQLNVAAEFADPDHPARRIARIHKAEMHRRLAEICKGLPVSDPPRTAMQIALIFDGAFQSDGRLIPFDPSSLLEEAVFAVLGMRIPG